MAQPAHLHLLHTLRVQALRVRRRFYVLRGTPEAPLSCEGESRGWQYKCAAPISLGVAV